MPLFFFHVHDGSDNIDHDGSECADLDEVRNMAIATAGEMIRDNARRFWTGEVWTMQVLDVSGKTVCKLSFSAT